MVGFQILVLEGRDLIAADRGGTSDPYLVISIPEHPGKTWKTCVVKKTLNPVWNEVFSIPVAPKNLTLNITAWDKDLGSSDDPLGSAVLTTAEAEKTPGDIWLKLQGVQSGQVGIRLVGLDSPQPGLSGCLDSIALSKMTFRQALKNAVELEDLYKLLESAEHMLLQLQKNTASVVVEGVETYISGDKSQLRHQLQHYNEALADVHARDDLKNIANNDVLRKKLQLISMKIMEEVGQLSERFAVAGSDVSGDATMALTDKNAQAFWANYLSRKNAAADWLTFLKRLVHHFGPFPPEILEHIRFLLDRYNTGSLHVAQLQKFLLAWGPWDKWLDRVKTLASYKWFFPKLNFESSVKALDTEPEGTYLARFSESSLDKLVIIYKTTGGDIKQTQVVVSQNGFGVRDVIYPSLQKVVASFGSVLSRPLDAQYLRMPWFHGVIDSDKASEWLSKSGKPGTFLVRFSQQPGCFAVTYVSKDTQIKKGLIKRGAGRNGQTVYKLQDYDDQFESLVDLVKFYARDGYLETPFTTDDFAGRDEIIAQLVHTAERDKATKYATEPGPNRKAEEEMYGAMPALDELDEAGMYGAMPVEEESPPAPRKHRHKNKT